MGPSSCATNDAYGLKFLDHQLDININILSRYRVEIDRSIDVRFSGFIPRRRILRDINPIDQYREHNSLSPGILTNKYRQKNMNQRTSNRGNSHIDTRPVDDADTIHNPRSAAPAPPSPNAVANTVHLSSSLRLFKYS